MWDKFRGWLDDGSKVVGGLMVIIIFACIVILIFPILIVGGLCLAFVGVMCYLIDRSLPEKLKAVSTACKSEKCK